jgi:hypothetical protein
MAPHIFTRRPIDPAPGYAKNNHFSAVSLRGGRMLNFMILNKLLCHINARAAAVDGQVKVPAVKKSSLLA